MKIKISLVVVSCLIALTGWAKPEKVLRIISGGEVLHEYIPGEFDAVEYQDSEAMKGEINGYEYVDLGLPSGLKWATCNVGANSPEECGYYVQWGETMPKDDYSEATCSTYNVSIGNNISGTEYDAARVNWGSTWRMPTYEEAKELLDFCEWQDGVLDGVAGIKVTGPNGNYIFLPYTGYRAGTKPVSYNGISGSFWVAKPSGAKNGYRTLFDKNGYRFTLSVRSGGFTVRPVSD